MTHNQPKLALATATGLLAISARAMSYVPAAMHAADGQTVLIALSIAGLTFTVGLEFSVQAIKGFIGMGVER